MYPILLVLTLCGSLDGSQSCQDYVVDSYQEPIDCLESISTVYNHEFTPLYDIMSYMGEGWEFVNKTELHCVKENKE